MSTSIQVSFSGGTQTIGDYIMIEQKDYDDDVGKVTMLDITKALGIMLITDFSETPAIDCGMNNDGISFNTTVYVYPYPENLVYDTGITHGGASPAVSEVITVTEELHFSLSNKVTIKYPALLILTTRWISDDVYFEDGSVATAPNLTTNGNEVITDKKIYGTVEVVYLTKRDSFRVSIAARFETVENVFQSAFYARFDGGVEIINVEPPPNAEENYASGVNCANANYAGGGGGSSTIIPPGDDGPPTVEASNIEIGLSYCEDFGHVE